MFLLLSILIAEVGIGTLLYRVAKTSSGLFPPSFWISDAKVWQFVLLCKRVFSPKVSMISTPLGGGTFGYRHLWGGTFGRARLHRVQCVCSKCRCHRHLLHCLAHSLHCLAHSLHCLAHSLHCLAHSLHCLAHSLHCLAHSLHCPLTTGTSEDRQRGCFGCRPLRPDSVAHLV